MSADTPLVLSDARHLLRRAGFEATVAAAQKLVDDNPTRGDAADQLLSFTPSKFKPGGRYVEDIANKWVRYMVKTKLQLQERLVLFWHDHFATSFQKVGDVGQMAVQNRLIRLNCRGSFKDFVKAINKDPAMMEFLDTVHNHKGDPNENYGRELQELFTLGVKDPMGNPNYEQDDVKQIARAFTGWDYDRTGTAFLDTSSHDKGDSVEHWNPARGPKVIYKTRGGFGNPSGQDFSAGTNYAQEVDNVIDIIFRHRYLDATNTLRNTVGDYIAKKLITYFAQPDPSQSYVTAVVDESGFGSSFDLTALLKSIFVHDDFYLTAVPPGAGTHKSVKWPVDYVVSSLRLLQIRLKGKDQSLLGGEGDPQGGDDVSIRDLLENMGQVLFEPPSVFGWDWETAWLSSATLLARYAFARDIAGARGGGRTSFRPERLFDLTESDPGTIVDAVTELLGVKDQLTNSNRDDLITYLTDAGAMPTIDLSDTDTLYRKLNGLVAVVLQSPVYQLQ